MSQLGNKRLVITGGSLGIGLAVAKQCAREGASLVLISRHEAELERAVDEIGGEANGHAYSVCDVGCIDQVRELAVRLDEDYGHIDDLVNCAGVYGAIGKIHQIDPAQFVHAININLIGTFNTCHSLIPLLQKAKRGKIVNYSGGGAAGPFPNYSAYAVSKAGVVRLTENTSIELKDDGIDVNAVAPGFVVTRLHQQTITAGAKAGPQFLENTMEQMEQGGVSPDVPAELTVFLLSSESDGLTGKFISAPWDPWKEPTFIDALRNDDGLATLRRIDNKYFTKKG